MPPWSVQEFAGRCVIFTTKYHWILESCTSRVQHPVFYVVRRNSCQRFVGDSEPWEEKFSYPIAFWEQPFLIPSRERSHIFESMIFLFPLSGICDRFLEVELASGLVLLKIWLSDSLADSYGEMLTFDEVPPNLPNCLAQNLHPRKVTYPLKNAGWKTIFLLKWVPFQVPS